MKQFFLNLWIKFLSLLDWLEPKAINVIDFIINKHPVPSKIILTILTYLSFVTFSNWLVAGIFIVAIFIHEQGHVLAVDLLGIGCKGFFPVPFLGGATIYNAEDVKSYRNNFIVALFGPIIGCAFAGILLIGYCATHWNWLGASAGLMVILNLFNMLPTVILDGGKMYDAIVSGFSDKWKKISYIVMSAATLGLGLATWKTSIVIAIILILGAVIQFFTKVRKEQHEVMFEPMTNPLHVSICVVVYLASILAMLAMMLPLIKVDFNILFG